MSSKRRLTCVLTAAVSLTAAGAWADSPSTQPTTKPAPTTKQVKRLSKVDFPSPADLLKTLKDNKAAAKAKLQVAYIDLGALPIGEKPSASISLLGGSQVVSLHAVLQRLDKAREDSSIKAVLLTLETGTSLHLAQVQEMRTKLEDLRRAGKRVFVHADSFSTTDYLLATGATDVCLMPSGELFMPGVGFETMFYKGLMEKFGVKADYVQIGEYKGAEEPYTRTEPSEELKGEMTRLAKSLYDELVSGISLSRNKSSKDVERLIDDSIMNAKQLKEQGYVDHLVDADGLRDLLKTELGDDINLIPDYGDTERPSIDLENPLSILIAMNKRAPESSKPKVAIVYAEGVISDGEGDAGGLFSEAGIGSEPIRRAMRMAARDPDVKAVVLRINSPGGSALASEVMWQSVRRLAKDKPVIVSIGGMAASGGYYMSVAGDYIVADPASIVGSIGVVGGKFVLGGLYDKLGLTTHEFTQGRNAGLYSSSVEWDDRQRRMVTNWMRDTYDQFTTRVMTTREGKIKDIDKVARGRIFTAREAKDLGMVDQLGGLDTALNIAADRAKLKAGEWDTKVLPPAPTLADMLSGRTDTSMASPMHQAMKANAASSLLSVLPDGPRQGVIQFIQMGELLQRRPVVLMTPFTVTVK
ncbi:MAG: signal peptide peptidase SppA [Tepidisphaeraceae bacterium]